MLNSMMFFCRLAMSVLSHWVTSTGSGVYPYSSCFWQMYSKSIFNCMKNNHDRCLNIRIIARIILYVSLHLWSTDLSRQRNSLGPSRDGNNFAVSFITSYSPSFTALSPSLPHSMSHTLPHILIATLLSLISSLPHFPHILIPTLIIISFTSYIPSLPPSPSFQSLSSSSLTKNRWFTVRVTSRTGRPRESRWRGVSRTSSMQAGSFSSQYIHPVHRIFCSWVLIVGEVWDRVGW